MKLGHFGAPCQGMELFASKVKAAKTVGLSRGSQKHRTPHHIVILSYCIILYMAYYGIVYEWYCTSLYGTVLTLCHTLPIIADHEVVWNGPAGVFEFDNFSKGTKALAETGCNPFESQIVSMF